MTDVRLTEPTAEDASAAPGDRPGRSTRLGVAAGILVVGIVVLAVSGLSLDRSWRADQRTVHLLRGPESHQVHLDAGRSQVYADTAAGGGDRSACVTVTGPDGAVTVERVRFAISPWDPANVILQTGTSFPTADFVVPAGGLYSLTDRCVPAGHTAFVAETQEVALRHVDGGLAGVAVGLIVAGVGLGLLRSERSRRRPPRYLTIVADPAAATHS
jgi:hypothetical protein